MTVTTAKTLAIEETGLERVVESERQHGSARDILWLWVGANLTAPTLTVGLLNVVFGLGFYGSLAVIVIFTLFGAAPVAYFSTWGPKTRLAQMLISRYAFGYHGAKVPAFLNALLGIGFIALNSIIGESFLVSWSAGEIPPWLALMILLAVSTLISLYGYVLLQRVERFIWLFMAVPVVALLLFTGSQINPLRLPSPALTSGLAGLAAVATFGGVVFAHTVSWGPIASDFTLMMPANTPARRVFGYVLLGVAGPCVLLELVGVLLTSISGASDPALISSGPGLLLSRLLDNPLLSGVMVLGLSISVIANNVPASYGLLSSFQLIGFSRISRPLLALCGGSVYLLLALLLQQHFSESFEDFLLLISYWLSAWLAIVVIEHRLRRGRYDLTAYEDVRQLPSGLPALLAMALGLAVASLGVSQALFVGPIAQALGGADLGYPLALVATGALYYPLRRFERARQRGQKAQVQRHIGSEEQVDPIRKSRQDAAQLPDGVPLWERATLRLPVSKGVFERIPKERENTVGSLRTRAARVQPPPPPLKWSDVLSAVRMREANDSTLVNLTRGEPLVADPEIYRAVDRAYALLSSESRKALMESYSAGWPPLLHVFRERLSRAWGREVAQAELVVLPGITQTLKYLLQALRSRVTGLPGLAHGPFRLLFPVGGLEFPGMGDPRNPLPPSAGPFLTEAIDPERFRILLPDPASLDWREVGAVLLTQPHITGRLWTEREQLQLADEALAHGAIVVVDAAEASPFAPLSKIPAPLIDHPAVLNLFTMSKVGLPGLRVGVAVGDPALIDALRLLIEEQIILPEARAQHDAWAALCRLDQAPATSWFGERYAERWQAVVAALRAAGALDGSRQLAEWEGGPYAWYQWYAGPSSQEVFYRLLDEAHVAVCPAEALQMGDAAPIRAIRIGLGAVQATEAFECALARLAPVLAASIAPPPVEQVSERFLRRKASIDRVLQRRS